MGGNRAAYASTASTRRRDGDGGGVHSVRRGQPTHLVGNNQEAAYDSGGDVGDEHNDDDDENDGGGGGVVDASSPSSPAAQSSRYKGRYTTHQRQRQRQLPNSGDEYDEDDDDDGDDDDEDEDELAEREQEAQREREEMRQRFTFKEHKRHNLRSDIVSAMRRKRRMLMRNENLRFRELYKPPEPMVLFTVVAMVTIVSLILTKSWAFY